MHITSVAFTFLDAHLADGFQKRQRFDVAHCAAHLDNRHICTFCTALDLSLDLVSDMRNDLYGFAQILAAPLLANDILVHLTSGEIVALAHALADKALVMPKIQVGFRAIVSHKHLTMLERRHRAGIHVDIRIELEHGDFDTTGFKDSAEAGGGDAFSK